VLASLFARCPFQGCYARASGLTLRQGFDKLNLSPQDRLVGDPSTPVLGRAMVTAGCSLA